VTPCEFYKEEEIQSCTFRRKDHDNFLGLKRTMLAVIRKEGSTINFKAHVNMLKSFCSEYGRCIYKLESLDQWKSLPNMCRSCVRSNGEWSSFAEVIEADTIYLVENLGNICEEEKATYQIHVLSEVSGQPTLRSLRYYCQVNAVW
jgi:hypothetical protein